jgi:hypothetical protein
MYARETIVVAVHIRLSGILSLLYISDCEVSLVESPREQARQAAGSGEHIACTFRQPFPNA